LTGALLVFALATVPAVADDTLTVVTGSGPTAFFDVLTNVASRAGFYREEHLTVTEQYTGGPSVAAQLVATGKGDLCSIALEPIILGYAKGLHLQGFFSRDPAFEWVLAVLDDSSIERLADFKGTSIGENSVGSAGEAPTNSLLSGAGLKRGDVSYVPIGTGAQAIQAITSGKVAGVAFPYPELAEYVVQAHLKFRYFWNPILTGIGTTVYAATPATIAAKADQLRRFARANVKSAILIRENPQLAARYNLEAIGIKATGEAVQDWTSMLELAAGQLPGADPSSKQIGRISPLGMAVYVNFLTAGASPPQVVPVSEIMTDAFIDYANDFDHAAFIAHVKRMR
jgi:ABC-type nitrate/sulfonate/bicarbonate transport system substrate-binding protein